MTKSKLLEMNNVGIVVENLDNAISFFTPLLVLRRECCVQASPTINVIAITPIRLLVTRSLSR
jgi:hypothetical protein